MKDVTRISVVLLTLGPVGCGYPPSTPSPPAPAGTVSLTTDRPDGSTLVVTICAEPESEPWPCTRDIELTFSVVLNRDLDRARVSTDFYTPTGQLCASATTPELVSLTAGTPVTMTAPIVFLSLQGSSTSSECGLPLRTTRMVSRLYQEQGPTLGDLLIQELPRTYIFVNP